VSFGWEFSICQALVGFLTLKIFAALRHRRSCGGGKKSQPSAFALAWLFVSGETLFVARSIRAAHRESFKWTQKGNVEGYQQPTSAAAGHGNGST
jgi:hypothetical protein